MQQSNGNHEFTTLSRSACRHRFRSPPSSLTVSIIVTASARRVRGVSFEIPAAEIFAFLGPNGSGKTTLFRILSTLMPIQHGTVSILGHDLRTSVTAVRGCLGVVFQAPSLDKKLTVEENMFQQAALYGVGKQAYALRKEELLNQLGLADRRKERTETLSGGLRRRVELAKSMIHRPRVLLLDEPSTGLDPGARSDLWSYLCRLRAEFNVTIVMTTHLLDVADKADRIGIMSDGALIVQGQPAELCAELGGDTITIETDNPAAIASLLQNQLNISGVALQDSLQLELAAGHEWIARIVEVGGDRIRSIRIGRPTLEDVFIQKTGHRFWAAAAEQTEPLEAH